MDKNIHHPIKPTYRFFLLSGLLVGLFGLYFIFGWLTEGKDSGIQPRVFMDDLIPFSTGWLTIYVYMYAQASAPFAVLTDRRLLERCVIGALLIYALALPIWYCFPVHRPEVQFAMNDYWTFWVSTVHELDPPTNCLPSMHVALSFFAAIHIFYVDRRFGLLLLFGVLLIWWSTVALRQHWFVDGGAGILLALLVDRIMFRIYPLPSAAFASSSRKWHLCWFGLVLLAFGLTGGYWLYSPAI